eukprot:IDg238t1
MSREGKTAPTREDKTLNKGEFEEGLARLAEKAPESPAIRESISINDMEFEGITVEQKLDARNMLRELEDMWQVQLGTVSVTEHRIDLEPGSRPVRLPPHRSGHKAREIEFREVEEMLDWTMDECIDLSGTRSSSRLLIAIGDFWQIPIREEDRDKTTFTCHSGTFRFKNAIWAD